MLRRGILKLQSLLFLYPSYSERIAMVNVIAENDYFFKKQA